MAKIGNAIVFITGEVKGLNKALGDAQRKTRATIGNIQGMMTSMGRNMTMVGGAITGAFAGTLKMASDSESASKQLDAVLASTRHAAGLTADQIKNMASELQSLTTFEDDAIVSGQSLLLTFTKIGGDIFPQATETMLNMSQALGQDMKSSAVQLGKALNDPIKGITALSRVGVSFTQEQRDMIAAMVEAGNTAGAQKIILDELATEFGGSARAAAQTFGGQLKSLNNSLGDIGEQIGFAIMPAIQNLLPKIQEMVPKIADLVKNSGDLILKIAGIGALLTVGGPLMMGLSGLLGIITTLGVAVAPSSVVIVGMAALAETFHAISTNAPDAGNFISRFVDRLKPLGEWIDKYFDAVVWIKDNLGVGGALSFASGNTTLITQSLGGGLGAMLGKAIAGRASGGPVMAGMPYMTGERGRELYLPKMSGEVLNNATTERLMAALGKNQGGRLINININGYNRSATELAAELNKRLRMAS